MTDVRQESQSPNSSFNELPNEPLRSNDKKEMTNSGFDDSRSSSNEENKPPASNATALADLGGRARRTPPLWDPILSFSHTFSLKSAHVGGPRPPPTGNPGSATEQHNGKRKL